MGTPPGFVARAMSRMVDLRTHTATRRKSSAAYPCVPFNASSLWACFLLFGYCAACLSPPRPCLPLWQVARNRRIMASARSR